MKVYLFTSIRIDDEMHLTFFTAKNKSTKKLYNH